MNAVALDVAGLRFEERELVVAGVSFGLRVEATLGGVRVFALGKRSRVYADDVASAICASGGEAPGLDVCAAIAERLREEFPHLRRGLDNGPGHVDAAEWRAHRAARDELWRCFVAPTSEEDVEHAAALRRRTNTSEVA